MSEDVYVVRATTICGALYRLVVKVPAGSDFTAAVDAVMRRIRENDPNQDDPVRKISIENFGSAT